MKKLVSIGLSILTSLSFNAFSLESDSSVDNNTNFVGFSALVRCESWGFLPDLCNINEPLTNVTLVQQHSNTSCARAWSALSEGIFVNDGCRATFLVTSSSSKRVLSKTCSSIDFKRATCSIPNASAVWVTRKLSNSECRSDQTWGYDASTRACSH